MQAYLSFVKNVILACFLVFLLNDKKRFLGASCFQNYELFFIFVTETISRTDEGQPRPKYIFNKCGTNIYFFTQQRFGPKPSSNLNFFWGGANLYFFTMHKPSLVSYDATIFGPDRFSRFGQN